jgi:hypothetical protein
MPSKHSDASALAPLLDGSTDGELIPELVRHGLQQLIELEVAAVLVRIALPPACWRLHVVLAATPLLA